MAPEARIVALRGLQERGTLPIEPLPGSVAQAEISRCALGNVGVLLGKLGGLRQVVPPHAREFRDKVFLGVNISGMAVASQGGREHTLRAGDAVLFSNAEAGCLRRVDRGRANFSACACRIGHLRHSSPISIGTRCG
jgi:hypothetical protein